MSHRAWRQAVKRADWGTYERVFRATALDLADVAKPDGTIQKAREDLAEHVGLAPRTFDYHLRWLKEHGWIELSQRAVNRGDDRRLTTYRLCMPGGLDSQPLANENGAEVGFDSQAVANETPVSTRNPQRMETPVSTRKMVANVIRDRASVSEHVAVNRSAADETTTTAAATAPPCTVRFQASRNEDALASLPLVLADAQTAAATSTAPHTERGEVVGGPQRDGDDPPLSCVLCGNPLFFDRPDRICGRCQHAQLVAS